MSFPSLNGGGNVLGRDGIGGEQSRGNDTQTLSAILNAVQVLGVIAKNIKAAFPSISTTQTTVGAAGAATALPAQPLGYFNVTLPDGTRVVVPYYNAS